MRIDCKAVVLTGMYVCTVAIAHAHGDGQTTRRAAAGLQTAFGSPGDASRVTRTISIDMNDQMRFVPSEVVVKRGETVRFVVANKGATMHEMVLGTREELVQHAALMRKHPEMEHDAPSMVHVKPGTSGEIVWRFNRAGNFQFACLIPGHFEAGMIGMVTVR